MIKGFIENINHHEVSGWAYNQNNPSTRLNIIIKTDSYRVKVVADSYREDLLNNGYGDGCYGFSYRPELNKIPLNQNNIQVYVEAQNCNLFVLPKTKFCDRTYIKNEYFSINFNPKDKEQHPLFILGAARSGTTAIARAIIENTNYVGPDEGWFFDLFSELLNTSEICFKKNLAEYQRHTLTSTIKPEIFARFLEEALSSFTFKFFKSIYWLDKTPNSENIKNIPHFIKIWPQSKFIYVSRSAKENIESRLIKFPRISFQQHCADWLNNHKLWNDQIRSYDFSYIVINHDELSKSPADIAMKIAVFLGLPDECRLGLENFFIHQKPESSNGNYVRIKWDSDMLIELAKIDAERIRLQSAG